MNIRYCHLHLNDLFRQCCDIALSSYGIDEDGKATTWHCTDEPMEEHCRYIVDDDSTRGDGKK